MHSTYACVISEEESQFQDEVAEAKDTDNIPKQQGPEENNKTSDDKPKEELWRMIRLTCVAMSISVIVQ